MIQAVPIPFAEPNGHLMSIPFELMLYAFADIICWNLAKVMILNLPTPPSAADLITLMWVNFQGLCSCRAGEY